jgi:hypothetical protein
MTGGYVPEVWITLNPQAGRRPAVVVDDILVKVRTLA